MLSYKVLSSCSAVCYVYVRACASLFLLSIFQHSHTYLIIVPDDFFPIPASCPSSIYPLEVYCKGQKTTLRLSPE